MEKALLPRSTNLFRVFVFALFLAGFCTFILDEVDSSEVLAQEASEEELLEATRQGLSEYKRGNYEQAVKLLEDVLAKHPEDMKAKKIRDEISLELAREFVENNLLDPSLRGRLRAVGQWFVMGRSVSQGGDVSILSRISDDPEGVARFVDEYMLEDNIPRRMQRAQVLRDKYGEFIVPYVQEQYFRNENPDTRARARALIAAAGGQAVLPLIQVMQSQNPLDRRYAALALGDIGDTRALPVLHEYFEREDQPQEVKDACLYALRSILKSTQANPTLSDAHVLWFAQAEAYYRNEASGDSRPGWNRLIGSTYPGHLPTLLDDSTPLNTVWRWSEFENDQEGGLYWEEVPRWNYADVLAEEACLNALNLASVTAQKRGFLDPDNDPFIQNAFALLACISMHQYVTGEFRLIYNQGEIQEQIKNYLSENNFPRFKHLFGYASSMGVETLLQALDRSLDDGYPHVSIALCDALSDLDESELFSKISARSSSRSEQAAPSDNREELTNSSDEISTLLYAPLLRALGNSDKRIRYAAARTLVGLGHGANFGFNNDVEQKFTNSLAETAVRTVMVIAEDPKIRSSYTAALKKREYAVVSYDSLEEGVRQATLSPVIDAIILEAEISAKPIEYWTPEPSGLAQGSPERRVELPVFLLQDDLRTRSIPLLLACPEVEISDYQTRFQESLNKNDSFTNDSFLPYGANADVSEDALDKKLKIFFARNTKTRIFSTNAFVVKAANVVHRLDPNKSSYDVNLLLGSLAASLGQPRGRTNEAKIALAKAMAHLAAFKELEEKIGSSIVTQLAEFLSVDVPSPSSEEDNNDGFVVIPGDNSLPPAVRAAFAYALGEFFLHHPSLYQPAGQGFNALLGTMRLQYDLSSLGENDRVLKETLLSDLAQARNNAGAALGKAPLDVSERVLVLQVQRASRHLPLELQGNLQGGRITQD